MTTNSCRGVYTEVYVYSGASRNSVQPSIPATHLVGEITCTPTQLAFRIDQSKSYLYFSFDRHHVFSISVYKKGKGSFYIAQYPVRWTAQSAVGSFFQHGNNSGKRDTVAFHGACNECSTNVDDLRISNTTLTCLAIQTCMTLCV